MTVVVVVVVMVVAVVVRAPVGEPSTKHGCADRDHHQAGDEVEPG